MSKPFISICIPAYKQPQQLQRSLSSLADQSFKDFEVIVTDDSGDASVAEVCQVFSPHMTLRYFANIPALGAPSNWNRGIQEAKGEYRLVLHHDDWMAGKDSLEILHSFLMNSPETDLVFLDYWNVAPGSTEKTRHRMDSLWLKKLRRDPLCIFPANLIGPPSVVVFRSDIQEEYDPRLKWVVDIDQYLRLLSRSKKTENLSEPLVFVTWQSESQTTHSCQGNPAVELFEWPLVAQKIWDAHGFPRWDHLVFLKDIFRVYGVYTQEELKKFGHEHISWPLRFSLFLARSIKKIKGE